MPSALAAGGGGGAGNHRGRLHDAKCFSLRSDSSSTPSGGGAGGGVPRTLAQQVLLPSTSSAEVDDDNDDGESLLLSPARRNLQSSSPAAANTTLVMRTVRATTTFYLWTWPTRPHALTRPLPSRARRSLHAAGRPLRRSVPAIAPSSCRRERRQQQRRRTKPACRAGRRAQGPQLLHRGLAPRRRSVAERCRRAAAWCARVCGDRCVLYANTAPVFTKLGMF